MSVNHQFIELQEDGIYRRYQKTIIGVLSLSRPNPYDFSKKLICVLQTPEDQMNFKEDDDGYGVYNGRKPLDYDSEVIEVYSQKENALFVRMNEKLLQKGLLVEYSEEREALDTQINALTDEEVLKIAKLRLPPEFKKRIDSITSLYTLDRIQEQLNNLGRPKSFLTIIDERKKVL